MTTVKTIYTKELRTEAEHVKSGTIINTDAPVDNHGKGEAFSPTDLLAASLGSCMLTLMGIAARNHGFSVDGTAMSITKIMAENPRRVSAIRIIMDLPTGEYPVNQRRIIEHAALTCPVAMSLHPDIRQEVTFNYPE